MGEKVISISPHPASCVNVAVGSLVEAFSAATSSWGLKATRTLLYMLKFFGKSRSMTNPTRFGSAWLIC
jgi:hypothetical protein